jgi:hypothetical protein
MTQALNHSGKLPKSIKGFEVLTISGGTKSKEGGSKKKKHMDYKKVLKSKTLSEFNQKLIKSFKKYFIPKKARYLKTHIFINQLTHPDKEST